MQSLSDSVCYSTISISLCGAFLCATPSSTDSYIRLLEPGDCQDEPSEFTLLSIRHLQFNTTFCFWITVLQLLATWSSTTCHSATPAFHQLSRLRTVWPRYSLEHTNPSSDSRDSSQIFQKWPFRLLLCRSKEIVQRSLVIECPCGQPFLEAGKDQLSSFTQSIPEQTWQASRPLSDRHFKLAAAHRQIHVLERPSYYQ